MAGGIMTFINICVLPFAALSIYFKREKKDLIFNFETVCRYFIYLAIGSMCVDAIMNTFRMVLAWDIYIGSGMYTAIGLIVYALLPAVFEIVKKSFSVKIEIKEKNEAKNEEE